MAIAFPYVLRSHLCHRGLKARNVESDSVGTCSAVVAPGAIDPFDPLLHWIDGRNLPGDPIGPVLPRQIFEYVRPAGKLPARGPRLAPYLPNERRMARKPYPVEDWVRGEFSSDEFARPSEPDRAGLRRGASSKVGGRAMRPSRDEVIHLRFQDSASWLTPSGVAKKRRMLERKGLPDMKGRRFLTLSIDRKMFGDCPLTGYLAGKEHVRRFLEAGRIAGLWPRGCWWAWKLEFQKDGWAHWHLILDRTAKFSYAEMRTVEKIWGLGRTNCRRISKSHFGYQFKYAFKGVFQEDSDGSGLCVPQWFLDHVSSQRVKVKWKDQNGVRHVDFADKPTSFCRARFWQTSKGFYTGKPEVSLPSDDEQHSSIVPRPVRQILRHRERSVLVISRDSSGKYQSSSRLTLAVDYRQFIRVHLWDAEHGAGCTLSARSFALNPQTVTNKLIEKTESWQLQHLLRDNRLTLRRALRFRLERVNLETF